MKKRMKAQAGIITTVLIILLILAAVIIVWGIVSSAIKKSSSQIDVNSFSYKGSMNYWISDDKMQMNISVHRDSGGGNITGIRIILEDVDGISYNYQNNVDLPKELETKVYQINVNSVSPNLLDFSKIKKISFYFIYLDKEGKNKTTSLPVGTTEKPGTSTETGGSTPGSGCVYSGWVNQTCGGNICPSGQIYQNRTVTSGSGCTQINNCADNNYCSLISTSVSYWKFNGDMKDTRGVNNGSCTNCPTLATDRKGNLNNAYSFNGDGNYIKVLNSNYLNPNQISVLSWVKFNSHSAENTFISKAWEKNGYELTTAYPYLNNFKFQIQDNSGSEYYATSISGPDQNIGKWLFIAGTYDGSSLKVYINGTLEIITPLTITRGTNTFDLNIGRRTSDRNYFDGSIDDVMIFNRSLTATEIQTIYDNQK